MSISNLLIDNHYNLEANSIALNEISAQPVAGANVLWINSANSNHLYRDGVDIEAGVGAVETFSAKQAAQVDMFAVFPTTVVMPFDQLLVTPASAGYNTATSTYTIPKTGLYKFQIQGEFDCISAGSDTMQISIIVKLNGAGPPFLELIQSETQVGNTGGLPGFFTNCGAVIYRSFNAGDTIQPTLSVGRSGVNISRIDYLRASSYFIGQEIS
jgi:hypothetical protein